MHQNLERKRPAGFIRRAFLKLASDEAYRAG
jgi:hypothetical protein